MLICISTVGAKADLAALWYSDSYFSPFGVYPSGDDSPESTPQKFIPIDAYHVLIWSLNAPPSAAFALAGTGLGAGEIAIWDSTRSPRDGDVRSGGGFFNYVSGGAIIVKDEDVGSTATEGYVYSRIFSQSTVNIGDWYYQSVSYLSPTLTEYIETDPAYNTHITSEWAEYGDRVMGEGLGMYQVIPEPGTITLSLAALGALMYRHQRRKRNQQAA